MNVRNQKYLVRYINVWGTHLEDHIVRTLQEAKETRDNLISKIGDNNVIDCNFCVFDDPVHGRIEGYCIVKY